ncbi:MAG TPA: hypothetical protein VEI83_07275 [Acidimicrobiales bacterium]|nr:hypothetical protein [Acidimicrobiales bacterium]
MHSAHGDARPRELSSITMQLRRVTRTVDRLWELALTGPAAGQRAMELGEASRALHQALLAMEEAALPVAGALGARA